MKHLILSLLLVTLLFSNSNPKVYAALGDVIYNDDAHITNLVQLNSMKKYEKRIKKYLSATKTAKEMGFKIEKGDKTISNKEYLSTLRELSKEHDFFIRRVNSIYLQSMDSVDLTTFSYLSQCSLIDFSSDREKVLEFYKVYKEDINSTEVDAVMFEQEMIIKNAHTKNVVKNDSNSSLPKPVSSKIKRIREKERAKEKAKTEAIEKETKRRKQEVQEKQKEELGL